MTAFQMSDKIRKKPKLSGAQYRKKKAKLLQVKQELAGSLNRFLKTDIPPSEKTERNTSTQSEACGSAETSKDNKQEICQENVSVNQFQQNIPTSQPVQEIEDTNKSDANETDTDMFAVSQGGETRTEPGIRTKVSKDCEAVSILKTSREASEGESNSGTFEEPIINFNLNVDDPGTWPQNLTIKLRDTLIENCPPQPQITNWNFPRDKSGRKFNNSYYIRVLPNGEKVNRKYLIYSKSQKSVFCYYCKLFGNPKSQLSSISGFNDWRHLTYILKRHEQSSNHINNSKKYCELKTSLINKSTIDVVEQRLYDTEKKYWQSVVERIIYIIQYLSRQCIAFRGSSKKLYDSNNGNFLKLVETVAKFDSIMMEHLRRIQTSPKKNIAHYLGDNIQNEIIHIISEAIKQNILDMVKSAKYYSIILDTTPDISRTEQLTLVIRFVYLNKTKNIAAIHEHFLGFCNVEDTSGQGLYTFILNHLKLLNLDILNLRGQGYDNGANMRGKHNGLQQKIIEANSRAFFVPCSAHSLNLVVNDAAKISFEVVDFFGIIQELYNFFSASVKRWAILISHIDNLTLKPLSNTRWESRIEAIKPLKVNNLEIYQALLEITNDKSKDMDTRVQANNLISKITSFKFLCSIFIWYDILIKINMISKMMQNPTINIQTIMENVKHLTTYLENYRSDQNFEQIINSATEAANALDVDPVFPEVRRRKKKECSIMKQLMLMNL